MRSANCSCVRFSAFLRSIILCEIAILSSLLSINKRMSANVIQPEIFTVDHHGNGVKSVPFDRDVSVTSKCLYRVSDFVCHFRFSPLDFLKSMWYNNSNGISTVTLYFAMQVLSMAFANFLLIFSSFV